MSLEDIIRHRRTICHYLPDPIPSTVIREMLALATHAPNIGNRQLWRFIVLTKPELRKMLTRVVERRFEEMATWPEFDGKAQRLRAWYESIMLIDNAPVLLVFVNQGYRPSIEPMLVEHGMKGTEADELFAHPDIQSISAVIAYFTLLAEERGYNTCWLTDVLFARKDLEASLELASGEHITAILLMGKSAEYSVPKARRTIDEIIEWR